jgi:predicted MFS family arabinose efflux permease
MIWPWSQRIPPFPAAYSDRLHIGALRAARLHKNAATIQKSLAATRRSHKISRSASSHTSSRTWLVLAAGFFVVLIGGGARFTIGLTLKPVVDELGWARSDLGTAAAVYYVVTAVATFYAGRLADRMNLQVLIGGGLVISAFGIGALAWMSAPWQAVALYGVVFAAGNGALSTAPVGVMVTRAFPGRTGLANAFVLSGITFGQFIIIGVFAAVLSAIGWRSVFFWIGVIHIVLLAVLLPALPDQRGAIASAAAGPRSGMTLRTAMHTRQFWLLIVIFAVCGLDDFFVATHVVAFAQDRGVAPRAAGNLFALMGLVGTFGVVAAGFTADKIGPVLTTAAVFAARVLAFAVVAFDQSSTSITIFALIFGTTFLMTAPITVLFVRDAFGLAHLGSISGLITMVHQIFGGIGAFAGAAIFDATGRYDIAFVIVLAASVLALVLTLCLDRVPRSNFAV